MFKISEIPQELNIFAFRHPVVIPLAIRLLRLMVSLLFGDLPPPAWLALYEVMSAETKGSCNANNAQQRRCFMELHYAALLFVTSETAKKTHPKVNMI